MSAQELDRTVALLTASGKGILAADESTGTIEKRFAKLGIPCTEHSRRDYRDLLFTTPDANKYLSGVILYEETLKQDSVSGVPFPELLNQQGIVAGIKVDKGTVPLPGFPGEKITEGLDGLSQRLADYKRRGARFAKWRAVIAIGSGIPEPPGIPTPQAIAANADTLARYAAICQEQGIVPIVEPEVLMDGGHSLAICEQVTERVLHAVFHALHRHRVTLEHVLLKPNMVVPGLVHAEQASPEQIAAATVRCLRRTVPAAVPGVHFLSGGQSETAAAANLDAINRQARPAPWQLSFSYSRALQGSAMETWRGDAANRGAAQQAFRKRLRLAAAARDGGYRPDMENASAAA